MFADPDRFQPERFLGRMPSPDALFPFGHGQRLCVGRSLAMMQLRTIVRWICQRYRLAAPRGEAMPAPRATITLRPDRRVRIALVRRGDA